MVKVVGLADFRRFLEELPEKLDANVLRNAVRAGAVVIADRARELCVDPEVRSSINVSSRSEPGLVSAKVKTSGPGAYRAPWEEYGTEPHLIVARGAISDGKTLRRKKVLKIGDKFVGKSIEHPGERSHPFMRTALDQTRDEAVAAMGEYVRKHLTKSGIEAATPEPDEQ